MVNVHKAYDRDLNKNTYDTNNIKKNSTRICVNILINKVFEFGL